MEGGIIVAVSCCKALSFYTSEIVSVSVCGPFSKMWLAKLWGIPQSFDKDPDGSGIICEVASVSLCFKPVDVCCKGFLFPQLDLHERLGVGMDISIAKFEP